MFPRWARSALPHSTVHVPGDNHQILNLLNTSSLPPPIPSMTTDGTWAWALRNALLSLPTHITVKSAWIKGHAGFPGSEISDSCSKWITYVCVWKPSLLLPSHPLGAISNGGLPIHIKLLPHSFGAFTPHTPTTTSI